MLSVLTGCGKSGSVSKKNIPAEETAESKKITLSDSGITVDGAAISDDETAAVYAAQDIVYYEEGQGVAYGAGTDADAHSQEEADAHIVVHITQPGTYTLSGTLSAGQIAVDLGDGAEEDPEAVVTIVLDGVDITCTVASAIIFYRVYECGSADMETATQTVDTSAAGANVVIADGTENRVTGSHVAKIYKPESVTLNADGTAVEEAKKLHKYDGALYSKMSMNIGGESEGDGVLNITGENEGLDTELHLTINGGNVYTMANQASPDGGLDADEDILINGGYVVAVGIRNDPISDDSAQQYIQLTFASVLPAGSQIALTDDSGDQLLSFTLEKSAQSIVFSSPDLKQDVDYTLTVDGVTQQYTGTSAGGMGPGNGGQPPELPDGQQPGDGSQPGQDGQQPPQSDGQQPPEKPDGSQAPNTNGQQPPEKPDGDSAQQDRPQPPENGGQAPDGQAPGTQPGQNQTQDSQTEPSTQFTLTGDHHAFSGISDSENG